MTAAARFLRPNRVVRIAGERRSALERARERLYFCIIVVTVAFLTILVRLFHLTVVEGEARTQPFYLTAETPAPPRGRIEDRNGVLLAKSVPSKTLAVRPDNIQDLEKAVQQVLTAVPELNEESVRRRFAKTAPFRYVKRHLNPAQIAYFQDYGDPGFEFQKEYKRVYPNGALAVHALGFTNADGTGKLGVEAYYNKKLLDTNASATPLPLSLDVRVQHALENELWRAINLFTADAGMGLVMDIHTGEILAMATLPDFDPNAMDESSRTRQVNKITKGVFELGSTFKTFAMAQGLELGLIETQTICDASQPLQLDQKLVIDRWSIRKPITMAQALIRSSNTCMGRLGVEIGAERQRAFLEAVGVLKPLRVELGETSRYSMSSRWGMIASATIAYGHGLSVTPLNLAQGAATLLNGGRPVDATLLVQNQDMPDSDFDSRPPVISTKTSDDLRALIRLAVVEGTGGAADVPGLRVGGKTGTAEKTLDGAAGYEKEKNINTFLGAFPMDKPRYVLITMLDSPEALDGSDARGAGANVAVVAGRVVQRISGFLGVMPSFASESWISPQILQDASFDPAPEVVQ